MIELRNETDLKFTDISSEEHRTYHFVREDKSIAVCITAPQFLHVSRNGGHRILAADGTSHYIPRGWHQLSWKARDDAPHFVK